MESRNSFLFPGRFRFPAFPLIIASGVFLTLLILYAPTLGDIAHICWTDDDYSHGLLLPFITLYLLWERKKKIQQLFSSTSKPQFSLIGVAFMLGGAFLYLVGQASGSLFASWISFFPTVVGALYLLFGKERGSVFIFPFLLNFMAKPLPDSLVPKLFHPFQVYAAKVSASLLEFLNVPVHLMGNIIEIPGMRLLVEEACSGMRSMMAILTVALVVIALTARPLIAQVTLLLLSVIVAMALNVFRVALTGVLSHFYDPRAATGFFHSFSGLVVFFLGLIVLHFISLLLGKIPRLNFHEQRRG